MAKELPYFKFEPAEYLAKDIQDCSLSAQGAFINICCIYWIRLGKLSYASALRRACGGKESLLQELTEMNIIKTENDYIIIDFLEKQFEKFDDVSSKNRENALKRWGKSKNNATASKTHCEDDAIREDKIREDEIRKDKTRKVLMSEANASDLSKLNHDYFHISKAYYQLLKENSIKLGVTWVHLEKISANNFTNPIRLIMESDNRSIDDLKTVWKFLRSDDFWMQNIQSSKKLREKFDQLITKAKNGHIKNGKEKGSNSPLTKYIIENDENWENR